MKFSRFMFILICLLVVSVIVGCTSSIQPERPPGQLTLEYLATKADSILVGEVNNVTYYQEGEGNIYTQVTLSVEQTVKGETGGGAVMRVPGGKVDGLVMMVTDTPSFQLGERGVVFLDKEAEGIFNVVGGFQGKFIIDNNNMVGDKPLTEFIDQIEDILSKQ